MKTESLILGTLTGTISKFAENNTLPAFLKTLAYSMAVNRPASAAEAYNLIEDICFEMEEKNAGPQEPRGIMEPIYETAEGFFETVDALFEPLHARQQQQRTARNHPKPYSDIFDADELQQRAAASFRPRPGCAPVIVARELTNAPTGSGCSIGGLTL